MEKNSFQLVNLLCYGKMSANNVDIYALFDDLLHLFTGYELKKCHQTFPLTNHLLSVLPVLTTAELILQFPQVKKGEDGTFDP